MSGATDTPGLRGRYTAREALQTLLAGSGLGYVFTADNAVAVKTADQDPPPADEATVLPEMIVTGQAWQETSYSVPNATTATKTDTPIMETPYSIKVVPQQVLQDQQVFRLEKALQNVSGVVQFPSNFGTQDQFIIRGFDTNNVYRDGFLLGDLLGGGSTKRDTANLERVEVLKGPGSILFGRNEPGGIINLVTKQPLAGPYYSLQQQFGSFDFYRTTADATGPITQDDTLLYRVNLSYENADSFRDFVDGERFFLAPVLRWNIGPRTQATFEIEYSHFDDPIDPGIPNIGNRPAPVPRERFVAEPLNNTSEGDRVLAGFHWSHDFNEDWTLRQQFTAEFLDGETNATFFSAAAPDGSLARFFNNAPEISSDKYFTSLNLIGKVPTWGLKHTLLFGFDYFRVDDRLPDLNCCQPAPPFNIFDPVYLTQAPVFDPALNREIDSTQSWYGVYFQDQIELPYNLFALGGFRYDNAESFNNVLDLKVTEDDRVSPRGGLLWRPLRWLSLYGSYSENFGAQNALFNTDGKILPPQTAQQWETGAKTELWDGRLSATFAYFELTKQNIAVPDPVNPVNTVTIGEAESRGVEFDVAGEILPGWRMIGAYSYLPFAEITKDVGFDGGPGNTGKRLFLAPRNFGSLWSTYEFQGGDLVGLKLGAGVVAAGQRQGDLGNSFQLPGYTTVNLLASYSMKVGATKLTTQFNVDNLLDKTYFAGASIIPGAPRTFLGSIRIEF
ncbi:MAG: TonB-dependent siderophore receptor [Gammaproteobacteria bacterium]